MMNKQNTRLQTTSTRLVNRTHIILIKQPNNQLLAIFIRIKQTTQAQPTGSNLQPSGSGHQPPAKIYIPP